MEGMNRTITHDVANDRLVFLMSAPDQSYWEGLWGPRLSRAAIKLGDRFVTRETQRVLKPGARVIDAGCGIGATVSGLADAGFEAEGIDYAEETVARIRELAPELTVKVADVRALPYDEGSLDGVWSLGVIEHFYDGYGPLIEEAHRVLKPGGYLFLTVPVISPLKAWKLRQGRYAPYAETERERFFQFAFRPDHVQRSIETFGFEYLRGYGMASAFGLGEDMPGLARAIGLNAGSSLPARAWTRLADMVLSPFTHHVRFFLFRKTGN